MKKRKLEVGIRTLVIQFCGIWETSNIKEFL